MHSVQRYSISDPVRVFESPNKKPFQKERLKGSLVERRKVFASDSDCPRQSHLDILAATQPWLSGDIAPLMNQVAEYPPHQFKSDKVHYLPQVRARRAGSAR